MNTYSLTNLSDSVLLRDLASLVTRDRATTAVMLAHIAEVDSRKLYLLAAYPSMYAHCVHKLGLSEDVAYKRIQAARVARRFPAIFNGVADGCLHVSAVVMLAPHLTEGTGDELLAAAMRKTKSEIEQLIAERFPRPDVPALLHTLTPQSPLALTGELAPGRVSDNVGTSTCANVPPRANEQLAARPVEVEEPRPKVTPLSPQRFAFQVTIAQGTHDKLRYAQELLGHQVPTGDLAQVLDIALDALIRELEKRKFAATDQPHRVPRPGMSPRLIPANVQREVWNRDQGRCTFVSESGERCASRTRLEFDHLHEVARGGEASVDGLRLRCRPHNQYTAECTFGVEFMRNKRQEAQRAAGARTAEAALRARDSAML